jgi:hypothetical protein
MSKNFGWIGFFKDYFIKNSEPIQQDLKTQGNVSTASWPGGGYLIGYH